MSAVKYGMILEDHGMPLLLSVYSHDGTVTVVQGGVEMGQGLFMKVRWHNFTSLECVPHGTVTVLKGSFKVGQTWWRWKRFTTSLDLLFIIGPSLLSRDVSRWEWLLLKVRWPRFTVVYPVSKWDRLFLKMSCCRSLPVSFSVPDAMVTVVQTVLKWDRDSLRCHWSWEGGSCGLNASLMIERSRVWVPAGAVGEFSSPGSTFCADSYFGICSSPMLPKILFILPKLHVAGYS